MSNYTYKIDENFTIKLWVPDQPQTEPPVLRQPHNPNTGLAFTSYEEAETWILNYIAPKPENVPAVEDTPVVE